MVFTKDQINNNIMNYLKSIDETRLRVNTHEFLFIARLVTVETDQDILLLLRTAKTIYGIDSKEFSISKTIAKKSDLDIINIKLLPLLDDKNYLVFSNIEDNYNFYASFIKLTGYFYENPVYGYWDSYYLLKAMKVALRSNEKEKIKEVCYWYQKIEKKDIDSYALKKIRRKLKGKKRSK